MPRPRRSSDSHITSKAAALGIPGINRDRRETRSERTYPQGSTTAALVGFMTGANEPGGGVEVMMQKHLTGTPGRRTFELGRDGTIIEVHPGQTLYTPPGEEHWHAAAPGCFMEHIAMLQNGEDPATTTTWGGHITDDEYHGR